MLGCWLCWVAILPLGAAALLLSIRRPNVQRNIIYLRMLRLPVRFFPLNYSKQEYHRHLQLITSDGEKLGAWMFYKDVGEESNKFVMYLHGNAGTRGQVGTCPP